MGVPDNRIPEDKLPQCWWDDVRMNALFAPFRVKSANPESWDMKMKFWSDMLRLWCRCKKDPVVSAADAKLAFRRKDRTAASIDIFIEEMLRSGELSPISKYQQVLHNGPEGWVRWGARLAFKPAAFALTAVSSLLPARQALDSDGLPKASIDSTQRFVLESAVKEQAVELLNNFPPGVERVGTVETLMQASRWEGSRETFQILLGYLVTQGQAVSKGDFIKLAEPSKKVAPLSSTDEGLAKLVDAETRLEDEATRLAHEISVAESEARASVAIGNKVAAKNHLRRRHRLQQRLTRCENTLENVRHLLQGMRDVDINASIVDTYKTSSEAMRRGMKENGLTEDAVYETLDGLNDVMDTYNAVEKALSNVPDDFDNEELEMELKDLISGRGGGGTPGKDKPASTPTVNLPSTPDNKIRKTPEDFIFDGEERVIAELNALSVHDASPKVKPVPMKPVAVATTEKPSSSSSSSSRPSQAWYPPSDRALNLDAWSNEASPVRQDDRIHPGQKLNVDFTSPPRFYSDEFQVQDHKLDSGVWLFNKDSNSNYPGIDEDKNLGLAQSTEYFSSESPGKSGGSFQMAPGGERKKSVAKLSSDHEVDQLQKRLNNLRGFNL